MSKVDRYWHVVDLTEDPEGDYVSYNDYETLEEERDKLKKCLELALYYVNGDSTYESLKFRIDNYLSGKTKELK